MYLIKTLLGDIIKVTDVQAIVNAANSSLLGGGGVDGAIHRAAGPNFWWSAGHFTDVIRERLRITKAYNLPCDDVIHTVGPIWNGGRNREEELWDTSNLCNERENIYQQNIGFDITCVWYTLIIFICALLLQRKSCTVYLY